MSPSERTLFGRSASGVVSHPRPPHRVFYPPLATPIVLVPAFGFYPFGFFGSGFCDPFWGFDPAFGCGGFGYGYGGGYGFGYGYGGWGGGYFSSGFGDDNSFGVGTTTGPMDFENDTPSNDYGTYSVAPSLEQGTDQPAPADAAPPRPLTAIYLKDGTNFDVMSYWLDAGKLHYITNYGGESTIDMGQLDLQRTVDENARLGVDFTLRPNPPAPPAQSQPAPQQ